MHVTTARIVTLAGMTKETERAAGEAFLETKQVEWVRFVTMVSSFLKVEA